MSRPAALLRLAALGVCAIALSGCISLLPKSKPSQLYRFGDTPATTAPAATSAGRTIGVTRAVGLFQREAAGDRLLTVTGDQTAYIAGARWVAPAQVLFDQAVLNAFDVSAGPVRLVSRGEQIRATYGLRLDVRNFETRYEAGPEAAPVIVVRVRASLVKDLAVAGERLFEARVPATENRQGPIVTAYDQALDQVLGELTPWVNAQVRGG